MNGANESTRVQGSGNAQVGEEPRDRDLVQRTLIVIALVTAVSLAVLLVCYTAEAFLLFFAAILLAILLRALSDGLAAITGLPSGWTLGITVAALVLLIGLVGWLLGARIASQFDDLNEQLASGLHQAQSFLNGHPWGRQLQAHAGEVRQAVSSGGLLGKVTGMVSSSLDAAVDLVVIFFLGLYLAIDPGRYIDGIIHLMPLRKRDRTREVLGSLRSTLRWWLVGRFLSMTEVGLLTGVGLWLLGVPLPFTLGLLTGLINFVPNIGPAVATILTGLVGLAVSPLVALYAVLAQIGIGSFDGFVVTPLIQQRTISLPAGLILGSQVLVGVLLGGLGVVLATPLAAATYVLVRKLYVHDVLGDEAVD